MDLSNLLAAAPPASSRHSLPLSSSSRSSSAAPSPIVSRRNSAISAVSSRRGSMRISVEPATDHVAEAAAAAAAVTAAKTAAAAAAAAAASVSAAESASASSTRSSSPHTLQISLSESSHANSTAGNPSTSVAATASLHRRNRSAAMSLPPDVAAAVSTTAATAAAAASSVRTTPVSSRSSLTVSAPPTRRSSMPRGSSFLSTAAGRINSAAPPAAPPLSAMGSSPKSRPSSAALSIPSLSMSSSSSSSSLNSPQTASASVAHRRVASSMTPSAAAAAATAASSAQKRPTAVKAPSATNARPGSARSASLAAASAKAAAATAAAAAAAKALAAAKAASHSIAPTTNDYSLLLHSPMGRATTTASPFMRPRSAGAATTTAAPTSSHGHAASRSAAAPVAVAPVSASSLLPRSASFGSLSTAAVPAWLLAETLARADAQRQFEVTALQAEKAALEAQLEEARLTISDLRYQGYRKDAAADVRVARHIELQRAAERARDHWGARYLWARRVIHAHKVLLLHVGIQAFLRAYMSKRNMLGLATSMRQLVAVIDRTKDNEHHDMSSRLKQPLQQAETRAFVEDGRALWQSVVRTPSSILLQNLQDGLLSLRTSLLSTLALKRTVSHTIESMFARNQELVATNLALREDLDALTPECADGSIKSPQLWKRPGLLRQVLKRMDLEERESARTAAAEALRMQRELELKAILAPNIAATKRSRRTIAGQGWASQVYVEAAETSPAAAAATGATGASDRPSSAGRFTPKPPATAAAAQNGISHSARSSAPSASSSSSHFVARPMPRTSAVAKIELSSKGIAYRHAVPAAARISKQQQQRPAEPPQPPPLPPPPPPAEDAELSSLPQPSWARHFRHPSFTSHRMTGHARTPSALQQQHQQQPRPAEEHKSQTQPALVSGPPAVSARRPAPAVPPHKRSILDVPDDALADADDQMMLGWRDDDSDEDTDPSRPAENAATHGPSIPAGLHRGLVRFRSAVHRVVQLDRSKYRSMKGALHELKHMDLANMHLDPDVD